MVAHAGEEMMPDTSLASCVQDVEGYLRYDVDPLAKRCFISHTNVIKHGRLLSEVKCEYGPKQIARGKRKYEVKFRFVTNQNDMPAQRCDQTLQQLRKHHMRHEARVSPFRPPSFSPTFEELTPEMLSVLRSIPFGVPRDGSYVHELKKCERPNLPEFDALEKCFEGNVGKTYGEAFSCGREIDDIHGAMQDYAVTHEGEPGHPGSFIKSGAHRSTWSLGPYCVIKVPHSARGTDVESNIEELHAWRDIVATGNPEYIALFAPVIRGHESGAWNILTKAKVITRTYGDVYVSGDAEALEDLARAMKNKLCELEGRCGDLHPWNLGIIRDNKGGNRLVVIDYGGYGVRTGEGSSGGKPGLRIRNLEPGLRRIASKYFVTP